jgi:hypothetical protein
MSKKYKATCVCGGTIDTDNSVYFSKWQTDHNAKHAEKILSNKKKELDESLGRYNGDGTCGTLFGRTYY